MTIIVGKRYLTASLLAVIGLGACDRAAHSDAAPNDVAPPDSASANASPDTSAQQHLDDSATTAKAKSALARDERLRGAYVSVQTRHGTVTLAGTAATRQQKNEAEKVVRKIQGVRDVSNMIDVKP